jgi:REP element-mobilizing transposase RayT
VSENILILTPYHDFGEMLRLGITESETYFPHLALNSAEALLVASQDKFSLAIIDTEIPGPSFHELWKDLKTMQPDMQLILIFPESEEEYPSLDGLAPLGCVDHLLYMPDFLELIDSAFPTVEESISTPAPNQDLPTPKKQEITQPEQHREYNTAWLEDLQIASEHLEKQLPVCSALAAMIARSDKVLAYSDQLEVAAAQEIANRFTRYWDKDGKNSDLVRFIHLGPRNNAYLLYVTALANETVLAALYQADTPLSQPHRQISKLARILLSEAPAMPQNGTGSLKMDFIDDDNDVFSQRMRMVTGSLRPLAEVEKKEDPIEDIEEEIPEDIDEEVFDPEQFHLEELLSRMPSPDPVAPETLDPEAPIEPYQESEPDPETPHGVVENLPHSWDSESGGTNGPETPSQNVAKRKPSPWETDGSLDIPETPIENIEEKLSFPWESNTSNEETQEVPVRNTEERPFPWETEADNPDEPAAPTQDTKVDQPYPWETESDSTIEAETPVQDAVESLRYPWESGTGNLEESTSTEFDKSIEMTQRIEPSNQQDAVESLRNPRESDTGSLEEFLSNELDKAAEMPQEIDPFNSQDSIESLPRYWKTNTGKLDESPSTDLDKTDETTQAIGSDISQDAVESLRTPLHTHSAPLTPPPPQDADEPEAPAEPQSQDAVESLRQPWEISTASLKEQPPNGHEEIGEDDIEPLPDFTDLESTSESPLGNGWKREDDTQEVESKDDNDDKDGTSPLKHPPNKGQAEEEEEDDEYSDCVYTYTTFVTPLLRRHALTRELAQILAKSMNTVCKNNHWKLLNMTARPSGMLWTARIPPNVTTGQMVKIIREETSEMLYEVHPRLKYEALSENFWAANYLVVSGNEAPDDKSIKEFLQRIHQTKSSNGSRH